MNTTPAAPPAERVPIHAVASCRYCQRYGVACGRHEDSDVARQVTLDRLAVAAAEMPDATLNLMLDLFLDAAPRLLDERAVLVAEHNERRNLRDLKRLASGEYDARTA